MKNKKEKKNQIIIYVLAVVIVALSGSLATLLLKTNQSKNDAGTYLDVLPYLIQMRLVERCKDKMELTGKTYYCQFEEYGATNDNNMFVKYSIEERNPEDNSPIGEKQIRTLYFQQNKALKNDKNGSFGVAEAE